MENAMPSHTAAEKKKQAARKKKALKTPKPKKKIGKK